VAIQYPGRQDRFGDPLVDDMDDLVGGLLPDLDGLGDLPTAILGHSMGASVAFESVLRLSWQPRLLAVSGRPAPAVDRAEFVARDDEQMLARLEKLGGLQYEAFAHPEMREVVLPILRADCHLIEAYRPDPGARTDVDILATVGDTDPEVSVADIEAWGKATTGAFTVRLFEGGHFYVDEHAPGLLEMVLERLDR